MLVPSNIYNSLPQAPVLKYDPVQNDLTSQTWQPTNKVCEIWPGFRPNKPERIPTDDSVISPSRLGTFEVMGGSPQPGCIPARDRLGPFGHSLAKEDPNSDRWHSVRWGALQQECIRSHLPPSTNHSKPLFRQLEPPSPTLDSTLNSSTLDSLRTGRTAVVLRAWHGYTYSRNQLAWLRALTTELTLDSGGRYQVFLLVHVKDPSLDLSLPEVYTKTLNDSVPEEFRDMSLLFSEASLKAWFPKIPEHGAQDQMYQALQIFSSTYPEFDFVWQLEMDARFTGHAGEMLAHAESWAREQPRKNLWERNARWYIPGLWKEGYEEFAAKVDEDMGGNEGVWGPHPHAKFFVEPRGPDPPDRSEEGWGEGEEAELITFAPLIDPVSTGWVYERDVHGFAHPLSLPRRMAIVSMTRTSKRLLRLISAEMRASGSWTVSESTPETWALLHGLKAVYAPHVVAFGFEDGERTPEQLDEMFHKGPVWDRAGGERAGFLWCRDGVGLPEPHWRRASYFYWAGVGPDVWKEYTNGACMYPMLLHPIKDD